MISRGRVRLAAWLAGAEGATAPETLRPMDRVGMTLWKAAVACRVMRLPTDGRNSGKVGALIPSLPPQEISQVPGQRGRGSTVE